MLLRGGSLSCGCSGSGAGAAGAVPSTGAIVRGAA